MTRSVGNLQIGSVHYDHEQQVFSVDMTFNANERIDDDLLASAALAVAQNFQTLLHRNGFWHAGAPETEIAKRTDRSIFFLIKAHARPGRPEPIRLASMMSTRDKDEN